MRITYHKNIALVIFIVCTIMINISCTSKAQINYYLQKDNYTNAVGVISYMGYNEDSTTLYLEFSELSPAFDDGCFKIVGENLKRVQEKGIDSKLAIGDQVRFVTAPKYFGDGYVMPIVGISINEEVLLDFEEGYINFISWLS